MKKAIEALKDWRCEVIHNDFGWPMHAHVTCKTCQRVHQLKAVR
jgi:hypothetical protein